MILKERDMAVMDTSRKACREKFLLELIFIYLIAGRQTTPRAEDDMEI